MHAPDPVMSLKSKSMPAKVQDTFTLPEAWQRALAAYGGRKFADAERLCHIGLVLKPDFFPSLHLLAIVQSTLGRKNESLMTLRRALAVQADDPEALNNRGAMLLEIGRFEEALQTYDQLLAGKPDNSGALNSRGVALHKLRRREEALISYQRALAASPEYEKALSNRSHILMDLGRFEEALASSHNALIARPSFPETLSNRGIILKQLNRFDEAIKSYECVLALAPNDTGTLGGLIDCATRICDWNRLEAWSSKMAAIIRRGQSVGSPFMTLGIYDDPHLQSLAASSFVRDLFAFPMPAIQRERVWRNQKIKIAYLSADFRRHALAVLLTELFELHDRSQFEVIAVSFGPDDSSEERKRLVAVFDRFIDVRTKSDLEIANLVANLRIDIAVDLMGHTKGARPGILAHRPAPIQANYLGFPGTTGAAFIDYIIADANVLPLDRQLHCTERIVHLPRCYQGNDRKRRIAEHVPTRGQVGLPATGFVFCCFNNCWKITPTVFDVWMRLLRAVEGSVLWLLRDNDKAEHNLKCEAVARAVHPARLVFADRIAAADHLARHRLADLFLDTLPYNAHTTASDALWVGLPVLTCKGNTFAARVAASLLEAIGLPDMVTDNLRDYESLALTLARHPSLLLNLKMRLGKNRDIYPLFDTDRFRRNLEAAYIRMWEIWQAGEPPRQIVVEEPPQRALINDWLVRPLP